ncbi:MAG: hypothetical protein WCE33_02915 [Nitrososphaeraceae archaeon]
MSGYHISILSMCTNPSVIIISVVYSGLHLIYFHKKCKISNVLTVDAIQKIVRTVFLHKHVQIAHGKNAVAGIIYINGVGFIADISNSSIAIQLVAWIAVGSGIFVLLIMKETRKGTTFG